MAAQHTTKSTRRELSRSTGPLFPRDVRCWQKSSWFLQTNVFRLLGFRLAPQTDAPELSQRHGQPEPLNAACSLHFAVVPSPTCFIVAEMVGLLLLSPLLSYSKKPIPVRVAGGQCVRLLQDTIDRPAGAR